MSKSNWHSVPHAFWSQYFPQPLCVTPGCRSVQRSQDQKIMNGQKGTDMGWTGSGGIKQAAECTSISGESPRGGWGRENFNTSPSHASGHSSLHQGRLLVYHDGQTLKAKLCYYRAEQGQWSSKEARWKEIMNRVRKRWDEQEMLKKALWIAPQLSLYGVHQTRDLTLTWAYSRLNAPTAPLHSLIHLSLLLGFFLPHF